MVEVSVPQPRIPVATYRVQFNRHCTFTDVRGIVPYLHELGISDIYASPYFKAAKGSLHGYDIVDPNSLNPEVGTEEDYEAFIDELHGYGMGQLLDIVPNHMFIESNDNVWWMDVLENGPSSLWANFFDIDWEPVKKELRDKVLIPILGDQYGYVLDRQELRITFRDGAFFVDYYDHGFPVVPESYLQILTLRLECLRQELASDDPRLVEFLSIITALTHLPLNTERNPEKIAERSREKEVIKKRLKALHKQSATIRAFINENVRTFNGVRGDPRSFDLLDELLGRQVYRLSYWPVATEEINYRRFFDINNLGAIRMEEPAVFAESNGLLFRLVREGKVTGLRVDHADGLYNPCAYLNRLQKGCFIQRRLTAMEFPHVSSTGKEDRCLETEPAAEYEELVASAPDFKPFYIVSEKILLKSERIPEDWPVFGTTGYNFMNLLNGIFVETRNAKAFDVLYGAFTRSRINFPEVTYEKKRLVMQVSMSGEINTLGHRLNNLSEKGRHTRDFTLKSLIHALTEVIAFYPVYRSYVHDWTQKEQDRQYIEATIGKAKRKNPAVSGSIFDFVRDVLLLRFPENFTDRDKEEWLDFVMKFQQLTGPVMAKGVEDTAFYIYNRLVSLNEVGGNPERFGTPIEAFHGQNMERFKSFPHAMLATSTHDTKRSEDVRARINVLSEIPDTWRKAVVRWRQLNRKHRRMVEGQRAPSANEEYFFYQTLVGAWPATAMDETGYGVFAGRIRAYMLKALREAKVNSSWINPDTAYEEAMLAFVDAVMDRTPQNRFLGEFISLQERISHYGMFNSLSQTLLKITCPGVPDFYQGTELWDFSLVDPDNRRLVDYGIRMEMLEEIKRMEAERGRRELVRRLTVDKEDGRIKLYLTYRLLNFRLENRGLFEKGEYLPLEARGGLADNVCAFARRNNGKSLIIAAPRFLTKVVPWPGLPLGGKVWGETSLKIPFARTGARYRQVLTGEGVTALEFEGNTILPLAEVFSIAPVALLESDED